jgi:hypothetical protein
VKNDALYKDKNGFGAMCRPNHERNYMFFDIFCLTGAKMPSEWLISSAKWLNFNYLDIFTCDPYKMHGPFSQCKKIASYNGKNDFGEVPRPNHERNYMFFDIFFLTGAKMPSK